MFIPSLSREQEILLQVSQWIQTQVLLDREELEALFAEISPFYLCLTGSVRSKEEELISPADFLAIYAEYVDALKQGKLPLPSQYRPFFSPILTCQSACLYALAIDENRRLIRPSRPVIQTQAHFFGYSPLDKKVRPMVMGKDSVTWGLQFSYPRLWQHPETKEIKTIGESDEFPNTALFTKIRRWIRRETIPTSFLTQDALIRSSIRLGKRCLSWINRHPQLAHAGLNIPAP